MYTEEPNAFEYKTQLKLEKEFSDKMDKDMKEREFLLNKLYIYLSKRSWVHDLQKENNKIKFIVDGSYSSLTSYYKWYGKSKIIKKFTVKQYNASEDGLIIYVGE